MDLSSSMTAPEDAAAPEPYRAPDPRVAERWPRPPRPSLRERAAPTAGSAGVHAAVVASLLLFAPIERPMEGPALLEIPVEVVFVSPAAQSAAAETAAGGDAAAELARLPPVPEVGEPAIAAGSDPAALVELEPLPPPEAGRPGSPAESGAVRTTELERLPPPDAGAPPVPADAAPRASDPPAPAEAAAVAELPPAPVEPAVPPIAAAPQPAPPRQPPPAAPRPGKRAPAAAHAKPAPKPREVDRRHAEREARRRAAAEAARAAAAETRRAPDRAEARRKGAQVSPHAAQAAARPTRQAGAQPVGQGGGRPRGGAVAAVSAPSAPQADLGAYRGQVIAHLGRFKRYPEGAKSRNAEGTPVVTFSLDARGNATRAALARSSGHADIDAEALAMVRRAVPFPAPPPGAPRSFTASVGFRLH